MTNYPSGSPKRNAQHGMQPFYFLPTSLFFRFGPTTIDGEFGQMKMSRKMSPVLNSFNPFETTARLEMLIPKDRRSIAIV